MIRIPLKLSFNLMFLVDGNLIQADLSGLKHFNYAVSYCSLHTGSEVCSVMLSSSFLHYLCCLFRSA